MHYYTRRQTQNSFCFRTRGFWLSNYSSVSLQHTNTHTEAVRADCEMPFHGVRLAPGLSTVSMRRVTSVLGQRARGCLGWGGGLASEAAAWNQAAALGYVSFRWNLLHKFCCLTLFFPPQMLNQRRNEDITRKVWTCLKIWNGDSKHIPWAEHNEQHVRWDPAEEWKDLSVFYLQSRS